MLPKIHKPVLCGRPIISSINSPSEMLSSFVSKIVTLACNESNQFYIKDSFDFVEKMKDVILPENYKLISLDVVNLFLNLPLELATTVIHEKWDQIKKHTPINEETFKEMVAFIYDSVNFSYNGQHYKQIFGAPMGGKASPILARLIMDFVLSECIPKLSFNVVCIYKFVDDIICAIPMDKSEEILNVFNAYNNHIQFTIEEEENNEIAFLDTKLIRLPNQEIHIDWHRKQQNSGRYIHYLSNHTIQTKINLILGLKDRVKRICHPTFVQKNLKILQQLLKDNGYPNKLITNLLYNTTQSQISTHAHNTDNTEDNNLQTVTFMKIDGLTPRIKNIFRDEQNLRIAQKNGKLLKTIYTKLKDETPMFNKCNCIYSVPCSCNLCYIGTTSQRLRQRLSQHKSDESKTNKVCALAVHVRKTKHVVLYENASVITTENNYNKRLFLEMFHIQKNRNIVLNEKTDTNNLNVIYSNLIQSFDRKL